MEVDVADAARVARREMSLDQTIGPTAPPVPEGLCGVRSAAKNQRLLVELLVLREVRAVQS
jgi:hypothetical protein